MSKVFNNESTRAPAEPLKWDVFVTPGIPIAQAVDTDHTTCLHVPSIGLVVAGDAAYNDVHLYLAESTAETRQEWLAGQELYEKMLKLYPNGVNPGWALWSSAHAVKP